MCQKCDNPGATLHIAQQCGRLPVTYKSNILLFPSRGDLLEQKELYKKAFLTQIILCVIAIKSASEREMSANLNLVIVCAPLLIQYGAGNYKKGH